MKHEAKLTKTEAAALSPEESEIAIKAIHLTAFHYEKKVLKFYRIAMAFSVGTFIVSLILLKLYLDLRR